ncbi:hypothetical protein [Chloroflexus sp.]|uniref:hypothetical protein n=1 Tax=Chloroflexus sp. TaxID=1904827 RepID=UPI00257C8F93|nr:hypothetical protein [Chloroflexus sp.]
MPYIVEAPAGLAGRAYLVAAPVGLHVVRESFSLHDPAGGLAGALLFSPVLAHHDGALNIAA